LTKYSMMSSIEILMSQLMIKSWIQTSLILKRDLN